MSAWRAQTADALDVISGVIHDALLDIDDVEHDAAAWTLTIPFAQDWGQAADAEEVPEAELVAVTWRYREEKVPFMRGLLRIANVRGVELDRGIGDAAMLLGLRYDGDTSRLTIDGVSGDIVATVDRLDVTCELSRDEVAMYVRRRHSRLFGWTSEAPLWD